MDAIRRHCLPILPPGDLERVPFLVRATGDAPPLLKELAVRVVRAGGGGGSLFDAEWPTLVIAALVVAAVGAPTTWIPPRRAAQIDPAALLRSR